MSTKNGIINNMAKIWFHIKSICAKCIGRAITSENIIMRIIKSIIFSILAGVGLTTAVIAIVCLSVPGLLVSSNKEKKETVYV